MAIKAIINNTEKEIEQIKNSDEQDIDYVYSRIGDTEVEGEPPISIKSIGGELADYRIYGNTANGESVGDLETTGEHAGEYKVPVTVSNGADTQTIPIYLTEQIKKVGDEAEYIDYAKQKQHKVRKNLWSGVVEQGNVSQDGGYGSDNKRIRSKNVPIEPGTYMISSNVLMRIIYAYNDDQKIGVCLNSANGVYSRSFTVPAGANNISIGMMKVVDGVQVDITPSDFEWGQVEKGSEVTNYEPYIKNTDVDVTLPALSTIKGTNTLSVETTIQPSNIYIKDNFDYKKVFTATRAIENGLPLNYKSIEDSDSTLKNYRIYGQTVDGESVGDRTGNLFNYETMAGISGKRLDSNGNEITDPLWAISGFIPCTGNAFTISKIGGGSPAICVYDKNQDYITGKGYNTGNAQIKKSITITTEETAKFVRFSYYANESNSKSYDDLTTKMLNVGTEALPYEPYGYKVPVTVSNGADTLTTPIYLPEQIKKVGDEAEYIDYAKQKQHKVRKNLLQNIATSRTISDVTFTVNEDGSVTCNGTNHGNDTIIFELNYPGVVLPEGVYITSGCPAGGSQLGGYKIQYNNGSSWYYELGSGNTFTLSGSLNYRSRILISKNVTVTNLTFYPMLRLASIADDTYEPYITNTELDVTLPALPVLPGTNTLTVGTEAQPSGVYIKGKIKEVN